MRAEAGARSDTPFFLVLLTDGKSQDDAIAAANRLKNAGVEIIAVGETEWREFEVVWRLNVFTFLQFVRAHVLFNLVTSIPHFCAP